SYPLTVVGQVHLGGISLSAMNALIICVSVAIMLLFHLFFRFSRYGQAMRAIAEDRVMAQLMGIHTDKYIGIIFIIAFALTGAAGVLLGSAYYVSYDMGSVGVKAFAAAVLGGFGDVTGAMVGGILLGLVEAFGGTMVSSSYRDVLVYGILILILIVRPSGILGVAQRRDAA
ncbi:MAG: branched-chain amino acid ABC transporter permease, partial [Alicyclobacillus sp.]|nr:branched-chain amino acid ABC transporter permease [Alicyclobacillus sp.]